MADETPSFPPDESSLSGDVPPPARGTFFHNKQGLRAGWRLAIYVLLVMCLFWPVSIGLSRFANLPKNSAARYLVTFLAEALLFAVVFLPAWIMSRIEHRSAGEYGLPLNVSFGKRLWQGSVLGIVEISALMGCIGAFGGYSFGSLYIHGAAIFKWGLYWGLFFIVVGFFEEFTFRGYLQFTLGDGIGFWPAGWILSLGFGGVHLMNKGEGWVGAASVAMIGLIFVFTLRRTGDLWFVVGWHAAFDFGETFLFSVPNSGNVFEGHLSNATLHGPVWLTGSTVGPEGSVFSFITMAAAAFFIHKAFPARKPADSPEATTPSLAAAS